MHATAVQRPDVSQAGAVRAKAKLDQTWARLAEKLSYAWGVRGLEKRVQVEVSSRLSASLARYYATQGVIRIASSVVLSGAGPILREVLGHEAAHLAVHLLHGDRAKPHGPEWISLMQMAGLEPRLRIPIAEIRESAPSHRVRTVRWEHRCPVCHVRRLAAQPVHRWRCAACRDSGLSGELVIRRIASNEADID
jgi:SprT protein